MSSTLPNTTYQREEINQACCFLNSIAQRSDTPTASREYAHSLPAKSREKKINLIIAKRGNSQEKQPGISLSKNLANTNPYRSQKIIKNHPEYTNGTPTHASKQPSHKNSLSTSRMRPEQTLKIQRSKQARVLHVAESFPLKSANEVTFHQTRADSSNFQLLSDITLVEEEFISHGSTTLNALNYLAGCNTEKSRFCQQANSTIKLISNYPVKHDPVREFRNPLERLCERRGGMQRKKLVL